MNIGGPLAVNVNEAGCLLGISPHTIRHYIREGKIQPVRFGRKLSIPMAEIERLAREGVPRCAEMPKTTSMRERPQPTPRVTPT